VTESDLDIGVDDVAGLDDAEFEQLEAEVERLLAAWEVKNLRGTKAIWHDDQHIGQRRRELDSIHHPSVDLEARRAFRTKPVVDSLEGNSLIHPLDTPIIEVNNDATAARVFFMSLGVEGLSKFREQPMAIISIGFVPGVDILEDGEWRTLWGAWQRTTKNEYHAGWVHSMEPTNTRPPLTPEQDRNFLGKYAYRKDEVRQPVPEPPRTGTWEDMPEVTDQSWMRVNLPATD
jgi:hypothetical protein